MHSKIKLSFTFFFSGKATKKRGMYKTRTKSHKKNPRQTSFYQLFYQRRISKGKKPHSKKKKRKFE
jgi:hypothetical protein